MTHLFIKRIGLFFFYLRRLLFAIALVLYGPHLFKKLSETQTEQYSFVNREVNHHVKLTSRKKISSRKREARPPSGNTSGSKQTPKSRGRHWIRASLCVEKTDFHVEHICTS